MNAQNQLFLLDLDNTLLDTTRFKTDLFNRLAKVINSGGSYQESRPEIARLYKFYCDTNKGLFSLQGYQDFLVEHFGDFGQEPAIRDSFLTNYKDYLFPEAKELVSALEQQGTVIIWTTGAYQDQLEKLTKTELIAQDKKKAIVDFQADENILSPEKELPLAIVDIGKILGIKDRLNWFLTNFPEHNITLIDNEARNVNGVIDVGNPRMKAIWFDNGPQKDDQLANSLRSNLPGKIVRLDNLSSIIGSLQPEGHTSSPEQKG